MFEEFYNEMTIEEKIENNMDYETSLLEVSETYSSIAQFNSDDF